MSFPDQTVSRAAILKALAEYLEQSDMQVDLDRELEFKMIYGIDLRASMDAQEIAQSLEDLLENLPRLIDFEPFRDVPEESWGEVAWGQICWNLE
jgi:transcription termination factor NusB